VGKRGTRITKILLPGLGGSSIGNQGDLFCKRGGNPPSLNRLVPREDHSIREEKEKSPGVVVGGEKHKGKLWQAGGGGELVDFALAC